MGFEDLKTGFEMCVRAHHKIAPPACSFPRKLVLNTFSENKYSLFDDQSVENLPVGYSKPI